MILVYHANTYFFYFPIYMKKLFTFNISVTLSFQVSLVILASKYVDLIVPGYTHLQRAQPVLLPHLLLSYVEQVI